MPVGRCTSNVTLVATALRRVAVVGDSNGASALGVAGGCKQQHGKRARRCSLTYPKHAAVTWEGGGGGGAGLTIVARWSNAPRRRFGIEMPLNELRSSASSSSVAVNITALSSLSDADATNVIAVAAEMT